MGVASVIKSWALQEVERRRRDPGGGGSVANWRVRFSGALLDGRGLKFNSPAKGAELRQPEPRSEDAAQPRASRPRLRR
jgi:hypothetical protein